MSAPSAAARKAFLAKLTLKEGAHPPDGEFCVMEAVAYLAGEPWSDSPKSASEIIAQYCRHLNDAWSDADRQLLKPYIPRLLGTRAPWPVERRRALLCADFAVRVFAPLALHAAGLPIEAERLANLAPVVGADAAGAASNAAGAASAAAWAASDAAWAVRDAAWAVRNAARAASAAAGAASAAAGAASDAAGAASDAAWAASDAAWAASNAARAVRNAAPAASDAAGAAVNRKALRLLDQLLAIEEVVA